MLERHGVIVLASPVRAMLHDAYSLWAGINRERAVIIAAAGLPGDRLRFSVAHELRHLTCTARGTRSEIEREADLFAAELLMPEEAMKNEIVPPVTLAGLAALKLKWGVAIQALVRRAFDLSIVSDRQYRYLMQQIGAHGWRKKEPIEVPSEKPLGVAADGRASLRQPYRLHKARPGCEPFDCNCAPDYGAPCRQIGRSGGAEVERPNSAAPLMSQGPSCFWLSASWPRVFFGHGI